MPCSVPTGCAVGFEGMCWPGRGTKSVVSVSQGSSVLSQGILPDSQIMIWPLCWFVVV